MKRWIEVFSGFKDAEGDMQSLCIMVPMMSSLNLPKSAGRLLNCLPQLVLYRATIARLRRGFHARAGLGWRGSSLEKAVVCRLFANRLEIEGQQNGDGLPPKA